MRIEKDIIEIPISHEEIDLINYFSRRATLGGVSRIRTDTKERQDKCFEDNQFGQMGTLALSKYLCNSIKPYVESRIIADLNPTSGDFGCDLPGIPIDIKTSRIKESKDSLRINLLVRKSERHSNHIYILAASDYWPHHKETRVFLIGWAATQHLPVCCSIDPRFYDPNRESVYQVEARSLRKLPAVGKEALKLFIPHIKARAPVHPGRA